MLQLGSFPQQIDKNTSCVKHLRIGGAFDDCQDEAPLFAGDPAVIGRWRPPA